MTALIFSIVVTAAMIGVIVLVARRRAPGTPLTWGEAFVAAVFMFAFFLMIYAVVPNQWLQFADSKLRWRSDKIGIPFGGVAIGSKHILGLKPPYRLFSRGITFFGRGKVTLSAQVARDVVAVVIYGIALGGQAMGWLWWQNRGKKKPQVAELTSAYGRPLVRKA